MQVLSKAMVLLLLGAVMAAPWTATGAVASQSVQERPAGCHEHGGKLPTPAPVSHQCCQASHYPAILQPPSSPRPPLEVRVLVGLIPQAVAVAALRIAENRIVLPGDPPPLSSLRI